MQKLAIALLLLAALADGSAGASPSRQAYTPPPTRSAPSAPASTSPTAPNLPPAQQEIAQETITLGRMIDKEDSYLAHGDLYDAGHMAQALQQYARMVVAKYDNADLVAYLRHIAPVRAPATPQDLLGVVSKGGATNPWNPSDGERTWNWLSSTIDYADRLAPAPEPPPPQYIPVPIPMPQPNDTPAFGSQGMPITTCMPAMDGMGSMSCLTTR